MLTFHVFDFCNPNNTARCDSSLKTLTQFSHVKKETKSFKKEKRTSAILGKGIGNETENAVMLYLLTPHCIPSQVFFFNLITAFQKTRVITRKDTETGNRTTRSTEWLLYEETLNRLHGSTDYREFYHICFNPSKHELHWIKQTKRLFVIPDDKRTTGDLELSRDQLAGTWMKRYHPQLLNTAVQLQLAPGNLKQQPARRLSTR